MRSAKYDYRDIDRTELMLIRAGHYLWMEAKKRQNSLTVNEREALSEAIQTIWDAKKAYREHLKSVRKAEGERFKARIQAKEVEFGR